LPKKPSTTSRHDREAGGQHREAHEDDLRPQRVTCRRPEPLRRLRSRNGSACGSRSDPRIGRRVGAEAEGARPQAEPGGSAAEAGGDRLGRSREDPPLLLGNAVEDRRDTLRMVRLHAVVDLRPHDRPADVCLPHVRAGGPRSAVRQTGLARRTGAKVGSSIRPARAGHRVEVRRPPAPEPPRDDLRPAGSTGAQIRLKNSDKLNGAARLHFLEGFVWG